MSTGGRFPVESAEIEPRRDGGSRSLADVGTGAWSRYLLGHGGECQRHRVGFPFGRVAIDLEGFFTIWLQDQPAAKPADRLDADLMSHRLELGNRTVEAAPIQRIQQHRRPAAGPSLDLIVERVREGQYHCATIAAQF